MTNLFLGLYFFLGLAIGYSVRELWGRDETDYENDPPMI